MATDEQRAELPRAQSLTRHEWTGLTARYNLADGHARQGSSTVGKGILAKLESVYHDAEAIPQLTVQATYETAFFELAGQPSVTHRTRRPQHHYSSSLSIEVVANLLRRRGSAVGLLHPTFDNIPSILRRHGVALVPVSEALFEAPADASHYAGIDVLFLVTPNNPTGTDPSAETLRIIADQCRDRGVMLILDFSFRFFSRHLAGHDFYAYLEQAGGAYIGIEDSGKTWPTLELKVGSLLADDATYDELLEITDDVLLNVSPFIFALLEKYILLEGNRDGISISTTNRQVLGEALAGSNVVVPLYDTAMSVALLQLPGGWDSEELCGWLEANDISVLPGGPFYWDRPAEGAAVIRIALMRPLEEFALSAKALAAALDRYDAERGATAAAGTGAAHADGVTTQERISALLVELAAELLALDTVSADDNFFAIGGDSLTAMHFVGQAARRTGLPLRTSTLFEYQVLHDFAAEAARLAEEGGSYNGGPISAIGPDSNSDEDPAAALWASFEVSPSAPGRE